VAIRSVFLLDFDNIMTGIWNQDVQLALEFANRPMDWLPRLAGAYLSTAEPRRWLVAKCYLNPAGSLPNPARTGERIYFSRFRPGLVSAGFEVIDCPSMTRGGKNAADIRVVIDALDLLFHGSKYQEFVIASGDSDFTPLLQRIRADDRLITVMSPGLMSPAYSSLADKLIDFQAIEALISEPAELPPQALPEAEDTGRGSFEAFVRTRYAEAAEPLSLSTLAHAASKAAPGALASNWFGGGFLAALQRLDLPNAHIEHNYLWDEERHPPPRTAKQKGAELPEAMDVLVRVLDVPRLRREAWPAIFTALADYAATHEFSLSEATRITRDQLAATDTPVGRPAIGYVVKGTQRGGAPLNGDPPPSADAIGRAFCRSLIDRAYQAGINLDSTEVDEIFGWFGVEDRGEEDAASD
jgi:hypothetical protein